MRRRDDDELEIKARKLGEDEKPPGAVGVAFSIHRLAAEFARVLPFPPKQPVDKK